MNKCRDLRALIFAALVVSIYSTIVIIESSKPQLAFGNLPPLFFGKTNETGGIDRPSESGTSFIYDKDGIPSYNYSKFGLQRNPLFIAVEVVQRSSDYGSTGDENSKKIAINNANWLVTNAVSHGNYSILNYEFPFPQYGMEPPWRSSIAQGKAVEALIKAHEITNNQTYLDTAKSLVNSFFVQVKDGGVTLKTPNEGWWYEGYTHDATNQSRVLNSMINSLLSIYDYYKYTNDTAGKFLFDQGVLSLKNNLPLFDNNGNSYIDNFKRSSPQSHRIHIALLEVLLNVVPDDTLRAYHDKWQDFETSRG